MADKVNECLIALKGEIWFIRSEAAAALGNIGDDRAVEPLIAALMDESPWVRVAALEALEKIDRHWSRRSAAGRHVPEFIAELGNEDARVRQEVIDVLGRIGDARAVGPIMAALRDDDAAVRRSAAAVLEEIEPNWFRSAAAREQVPDFIAALRKPDPEVRRSAASILENVEPNWPQGEEARRQVPEFIAALKIDDLQQDATEILGKIGDPKAIMPILEVLRSQDDSVRKAAAAALKKLGRASVEPLIAALRNPAPGVRENAAAVLREIDPNWPRSHAALRQVPEIIAALQEAPAGVQCIMAEALGNIGNAGAVDPLIAVLRNRNAGKPDVLFAVALALGKLRHPKAAEPLVAMLQNEHEAVRHAAVTALGMIDSARVVEPLIGILGDRDAKVRGTATEVLIRAGSIAIEPLVVALQHKDSAVREAVSAVLEKIDPNWSRSSAARRHLTGFIAALGNPDPYVRLSAAEALGKLGDSRAVRPLIAALGYGRQPGDTHSRAIPARNIHVQCAAAAALGRIGDPRAVKPLAAALENPAEEPGMRCAAAVALGRIGDAHAVMPLISAARWGQSWQVQNAAEEALASLGPIILEPLIAALRDPSRSVRNEAAELLAQFEPRWLAPLLASYPGLLCSGCGLRARRNRLRTGFLRWKTVVACRGCGRLHRLITGVEHVAGIVGGAGRDFEREDGVVRIRLWSETDGVARNADIDSLVIREGGVEDYGRAVTAVIGALKGDRTRPARWYGKIPVFVEGRPSLSPAVLAGLRNAFGKAP